MRVVRHLFRVYGKVYAWFWSIMALVLTALMSSLVIFGPWVNHTDQSSAWWMVATQAPRWFLFVMGIMMATTGLPIAIANGVTRHDFTVGTGIFALGSSVVFGLLTLIGFGVEYVLYRAGGIMDMLTLPYVVPSPGAFTRAMLGHLAFMVAGWLTGLTYYRLRVWWALAATPILVFPLAAGVDELAAEWWLSLLVVCLALPVAYLFARSVPVRPKKA